MPPSIWAAIVSGLTDHAAIDGADDAMHLDRAVGRDLDLRHLREVAAEGEFDRDAAALPAGSGVPQPAFSAASVSTASARGLWPSSALR